MKKLTTDEFILKVRLKHGNKYDYSNVVYKNSYNNIIIGCGIHGNFESLPNNFLNGKGCPKCSNKIPTNEQFIIKARKIHGYKYDYSLVKYLKTRSLLKIKCNIHGIFKQTAAIHLNGGGCKKCAFDRTRLNNNDIVIKFKNKHGEKYDYSKTKYINKRTKVEIICKKHGVFKQRTDIHLRGSGCPKCSAEHTNWWTLNKWVDKVSNNHNSTPRLYVLKCYNENESFIKIGITMYNVKKRYHNKISMPYNFDILFDSISTAELVFKVENLTKKLFKAKKYFPKLKFDGTSECFKSENETEILNYCSSFFS